MGDISIDFVTQFHNIEGNLISERKKNFNKLLKSSKSLISNEEQLNLILQTLEPKTYLESLFRIDVLIFFKRTSELVEILKEGNEVFISKIIKQLWFFEEAFKNISADNLVNEFLPSLSYSIRMKVLKKLSKIFNETQMDEIFDCLLKRYGLFIAKHILDSCSSGKIEEVLQQFEVNLRPNQVRTIFDKDTNLFRMYLKHYKEITTGFKYSEEKVMNYVALKNPKLLMELKDEFCAFSLGRRTSKAIVELEKNNIIHDINKYTQFLKKDVVVRKLGGEFKNIYYDLFPRKKEDINIGHDCLLLYLPKKQRWDMFAQTFAHVFNADILDNLTLLNKSIFKLNPKIDVVRKWADAKYDVKKDTDFLKYVDARKAIPLIKEKINVTSKIHERSALQTLLLETCAQNNDLKSLEEVLEYLCFRHRNEDSYTRNAILSEISDNFKLEDLNENHWKFINEQIQIFRINEDFSYWRHSVFTKKYLEFLFKHKKSFMEELIQYIKDTCSQNDKFLLDLKNPVIEKEILKQIILVFPIVFDEDYDDYLTTLIRNVITFSEDNPEYCINLSEFPELVDHIKLIFEKTSDFKYNDCTTMENVLLYNLKFPKNAIVIENVKVLKIILTIYEEDNVRSSFNDFLKKMVMKTCRSEFENKMVDTYFRYIFEKNTSKDIIIWFLKNEPQTIGLYFDKIVKHSLNNTYFIFKDIKLYSHLKYDQKVILFYEKELHNKECNYKKQIMQRLSVLLSTEAYIKVVEDDYLPQKEKLDLADKEMKEMYKLQCEVVKTFNNVIEPMKMLPVVIKFCLGDYLQSALQALYGIFYRSPEKQLCLYIDILSKRAVSVRKHAVFLSCELLDMSRIMNVLTSTKHKNISSQKHLFTATLKFYTKNQSQDLLDLLISNMHTIDKNDSETLESLARCNKIPNIHRALYIEKCWKFFEDVEKKGICIDGYLRSLVLVILDRDMVNSLSLDFCENIIMNYFKIYREGVFNMENLVCKFLLYKEVDQTNKFNFIFEIISTFKANGEDRRIRKFFQQFFDIASDEGDSNFVKVFTQYWTKLFKPLEMFEEYILLELLSFKFDSVENYAKNIVTFFEQLVSDYTLHVYNKFLELLRKALNLHFEVEEDKYLIFLNILRIKITPSLCILILDLMSKIDCENSERELCSIYKEILEIIKNVNEPIVIIYYNSYLR